MRGQTQGEWAEGKTKFFAHSIGWRGQRAGGECIVVFAEHKNQGTECVEGAQ